MAEHFLQGHTPANPCSQSGPLLFLPCRCGAPMGHANLAGHLLQPRVPHPGTVISSLFWSEHFLQEGSRMSSHPIRAPGSSMSCLLGAARGGGGGLQEPGVQKPGALSPGACGLSSCESSIYIHPSLWDLRGSSALGSAVEPPRAVLLSPEGRWDKGERSQDSRPGN